MQSDPAADIARNWYKSVNLVYKGIDFGVCITYDVLQIVNRNVLRQKQEKAEREKAEKNE